MRTGQTIICGWPGLLLLWRHGRSSGLLVALGFAVLLNGAVVATFAIPEHVTASLRTLLWALVGAVWTLATWWSLRHIHEPVRDVAAEVHEGLFLQAQAEYLKGHWFEAEALLSELLKHCPDDAEARLLFAGLLRRSQRADEAARQLRRLQRGAGAMKWELEIQRERALLQAGRAPRPSEEAREAASGDDEVTARAA